MIPNPASAWMIVEMEGQAIERIEIFSMTGQKVYDKLSNGEEVSLDVSQYKPGVYVLHIYGKDGFDLKKVVVN